MTSVYPYPLAFVQYYYPVGNTPAVCLTQELDPDYAAQLLLLGCGDARNILFTAYADSRDDRCLDFTCCDIQASVLARNTLLFALITDPTYASKTSQIWNIYCSLHLTEDDASVLHSKLEELLKLSRDIETWRQGRYGKLIQFLDAQTFREVRHIWSTFSVLKGSAAEKATFEKDFGHTLAKSKLVGIATMGNDPSYTATRSSAPFGVQSLEDMSIYHHHFWSEPSPSDPRQMPNPTFMPRDGSTSLLHYATDPLLGFHMSLAYASLEKGSPLHAQVSDKSRASALVNIAKSQFEAWSKAFRRRDERKGLVVRVFAGDAIAFSYALRDYNDDSSRSKLSWYQRPDKPHRIRLDPRSVSDLTSFDVIDTSNLADHLGPTTVLAASIPLLKSRSDSSLYIEALVRQHGDLTASAKELLLGPLGTMSALLSVFPVEHWTNSSAASPEEVMLDTALRGHEAGESSTHGQMFSRMLWKKPMTALQVASSTTRYDPEQLANLLLNIYLNMFQHENLRQAFTKLDLGRGGGGALSQLGSTRFHRGSFAALLAHVRSVIDTDWESAMDRFTQQIEVDGSLILGSNFLSELWAQLYLRDLLSSEWLEDPRQQLSAAHDTKGGLHSWINVPGVLRVTLVVPRNKLKYFTDHLHEPTKLGTPHVLCHLESSEAYGGPQYHNMYAAVHMTFGDVIAQGQQNTSTYSISILPDEHGWQGRSPLLVSFWAPTAILLVGAEHGMISFGLQSTPLSMMLYGREFGPLLKVFETCLGDADHVFITKDLPREADEQAPLASSGELVQVKHDKKVPSITMTANLNDQCELASLTARLNIADKARLTNKAPVTTSRISAFEIAVSIGQPHSLAQHSPIFPLPVNQTEVRLRIARQSGWVEVIVPTRDPLSTTQAPDLLTIKRLDEGKPILWNMPRLRLSQLPILDLRDQSQISWLATHLSTMWSTRERVVRERHYHTNDCPDAKLNFKELLFALFVQYTGVQGRRANVFGLANTDSSEIDTVLIPQALELDIANHTVVLDTIILAGGPMPAKLFEHIVTLPVGTHDLEVWKHMLPVYVERCRTWSHKSSCEYKEKNRIPLSTKRGETSFCSCGIGKVEKDAVRNLPGWNTVKGHAVRAAISPLYGLPFVEKLVDDTIALTNTAKCARCDKKGIPGGGALLKCGGCRKVAYCSKECQKQGWPAHKTACKKT